MYITYMYEYYYFWYIITVVSTTMDEAENVNIILYMNEKDDRSKIVSIRSIYNYFVVLLHMSQNV